MPEGFFPTGFTIWDFLNSEFLNTVSATLVAVVLALVGRSVTKSNEDVAAQEGALSASQQAQNIEAAAEQPAEAPEAAPQEDDVRTAAKSIVDEACHPTRQTAPVTT